MTIGERLKNRRILMDMTLEDVAKMIGISRQTMSRYETGIIGNIPSDKIEALAKALLTTPAYLMGWEDDELTAPTVTDDVVSFPVLGSIAAGYDKLAVSDSNWSGSRVDIPREYLHGRPASDYFVLKVEGNSMYPLYMAGDLVLVLRQATLNRSGEIGVVIYDDDKASLKKVEYVPGEDWFRMIPINPQYQPTMVEGEKLEHCRVLGIPKLLIREIEQ